MALYHYTKNMVEAANMVHKASLALGFRFSYTDFFRQNLSHDLGKLLSAAN
ncbi:MAG: hypothetical protein PHQ23_12880 [Candidatus Wallbacteria bacterium]|nr:hypothetical protein [Candidatus Wallbacteria bacterium]